MGGAGILHKNVIKLSGLNENEFGGIAFGLGVERISMIKYGIEDIRELYQGDSRFMRQFANEGGKK
jgi:phenylalanyl-tRNA synthetase alpha chain